MAGTFVAGETKVRPGTYFRVTKKGEENSADYVDGILACIVNADYGPLGKVVTLNNYDGYESVFGNSGTTDVIKNGFKGGAKTILAVRNGAGGTAPTVTLTDGATEESKNEIVITGKYVGAKAFAVSVSTKLTDATKKVLTIYSENKEVEKYEATAGAGDVGIFIDLINNASENFTAALATGAQRTDVVGIISQKAFTAGTNPTITNANYSASLELLESFTFNAICVDTNDTDVHALLFSFLERVYNAGLFAIGIVAEASTVALLTREDHAAAYNDHRMVYVLNTKVVVDGEEVDGWKTAAIIAGMVSAIPANKSLTHSKVPGVASLEERLTNSQIVAAELKGCIVLSLNSSDQVWIDSAINTLISPDDDHDDGWKKIRRTKARYELMYRVNNACDELIGKVDNNDNGRKTIKAKILEIGDKMGNENKITSLSCEIDETQKNDGDQCFFNLDIVDLDSTEHIYLTYQFQFSTNVE